MSEESAREVLAKPAEDALKRGGEALAISSDIYTPTAPGTGQRSPMAGPRIFMTLSRFYLTRSTK